MSHVFHITLAKGLWKATYTATYRDSPRPTRVVAEGNSRYFRRKDGNPVSFDRFGMDDIATGVIHQAAECGAEARIRLVTA